MSTLVPPSMIKKTIDSKHSIKENSIKNRSKVIWKRLNCGGGFGFDFPVIHRFYGREF